MSLGKDRAGLEAILNGPVGSYFVVLPRNQDVRPFIDWMLKEPGIELVRWTLSYVQATARLTNGSTVMVQAESVGREPERWAGLNARGLIHRPGWTPPEEAKWGTIFSDGEVHTLSEEELMPWKERAGETS